MSDEKKYFLVVNGNPTYANDLYYHDGGVPIDSIGNWTVNPREADLLSLADAEKYAAQLMKSIEMRKLRGDDVVKLIAKTKLAAPIIAEQIRGE